MSKKDIVYPEHHEVEPDVLRGSSQEPESRGPERTHISMVATSIIAEEEVQSCLDARSSVPGSSQEKPTTAPEPARNVGKNLGSSSLAFATNILPTLEGNIQRRRRQRIMCSEYGDVACYVGQRGFRKRAHLNGARKFMESARKSHKFR
jgi:hypothetical protein